MLTTQSVLSPAIQPHQKWNPLMHWAIAATLARVELGWISVQYVLSTGDHVIWNLPHQPAVLELLQASSRAILTQP